MIANIYRPPNELVDSYNEFIDRFTSILNNLESSNGDVIIAGDYNIDLLKINDKPKISQCFDNFFCKLSEYTLETTSGVLIKTFSEHQPYFTLIDFQ